MELDQARHQQPTCNAWISSRWRTSAATVRQKPNLNFMLIANRAEGDIRELLELVPTKRIHVIIDANVR